MKKIKKIILTAVLGIAAVTAIYLLYVFVSYKRLPDNIVIDVEEPATGTASNAYYMLKKNTDYTAFTYNIGFGAYTPDFSFFMDGGKSSWAKSRESVTAAVGGAAEYAYNQQPDFALIQEMDIDGTRSWHVNEFEVFSKKFNDYYKAFAQNYDSAFLMYPLTQPHGKNKSGIALYSKYKIESALRRSFPISTSFTKFLDLDRCYSISAVPVENEKKLIIINLHMSAYGHSDEVRTAQIKKLFNDMEKEYKKGNYVLCGGDFNHNLKAQEGAVGDFETYTHPFPRSSLPEGFYFAMDRLGEDEKSALRNTSRDSGRPFIEGESETVTLDGFIFSENIEMIKYENLNTGFSFSDHEPVKAVFELK
ncbi:hypothetical protein HMPREF9333_00963 [Johnsonella ignava ATCC 51276]|jgi:hypothetical protein|uniref:Endonuclease/exonuclease/phosphatase domain-containing protein n=1 Tax=Johnsonella ignava ATCC 51276 TaxID=679200 RepID=G5GHC3_9FIRM|nr:endonuclease/exonuclease/phosphatase family protein [Johnsonella ignava]EHI55920.1 hypothetical protein HMPREF9333_00963 [Johnsonella ignava ATCC 51276]